MAYNVVDEFVIMRDGKVLHVSEIGSTVELSNAEAAELLAAGKISAPLAEGTARSDGAVAAVAPPEDEVEDPADDDPANDTDSDRDEEPADGSRR